MALAAIDTKVAIISKLGKSGGISAGKSANGIKMICPFAREVPDSPTLPTSRSNYFGVAWIAAASPVCRSLTSLSRLLSLVVALVRNEFRVLMEPVLVAVWAPIALTPAVLEAI